MELVTLYVVFVLMIVVLKSVKGHFKKKTVLLANLKGFTSNRKSLLADRIFHKFVADSRRMCGKFQKSGQ